MKRFFGVWWMIAALAGFHPQALARADEAEDLKNQASADALFTNGTLHLLKIEIPRAGVRSLNQDPRAYVKATLREGSTVYSNILIASRAGPAVFADWETNPA